ncbi:MAG TPA: Asp-tRNA(Asn)/Glu-tRNA(Gln) amidotransferase subunit GatC [Candidatus Acidoferrales bacterium]|nr:Asp-tRNA(Asn)/Glu-tRNA(Gln) amidotransferase subunit GatC [Candidatus Acidoferrales bacterium]
MKISREEVLRIAELAHLGLSPEEVDMYCGQLDGILGYIDKLKEIDISNVEPMAQVLHAGAGSDVKDSHPELRDDTLLPCDIADAVLAAAPDAEKPFFRVPKVITR